MILRDRRLALLLGLFALSATGAAGDAATSMAAHSPLTIPHSLNLTSTTRPGDARGAAGNFESSAALDLPAGLQPLIWPRNSDMRARLLTPNSRPRRCWAGSPQPVSQQT